MKLGWSFSVIYHFRCEKLHARCFFTELELNKSTTTLSTQTSYSLLPKDLRPKAHYLFVGFPTQIRQPSLLACMCSQLYCDSHFFMWFLCAVWPNASNSNKIAVASSVRKMTKLASFICPQIPHALEAALHHIYNTHLYIFCRWMV